MELVFMMMFLKTATAFGLVAVLIFAIILVILHNTVKDTEKFRLLCRKARAVVFSLWLIAMCAMTFFHVMNYGPRMEADPTVSFEYVPQRTEVKTGSELVEFENRMDSMNNKLKQKPVTPAE